MAESQMIREVIYEIDTFYQKSFELPSEQCAPLIISFVDKVVHILGTLSPKQTSRLNEQLSNIIQAMQVGDYVLVKDYLVYEVKPLLSGVLSASGGK